MSQGSFDSFRGRALRDTFAVGSAAGLGLMALVGRPAAIGFTLGALGSALALGAHGRAVAAEASLPPAPGRRRARLSSLGRTALRAGILTVALARPEVSFPWAAAGLFLGSAVLVARAVGEGRPSR